MHDPVIRREGANIISKHYVTLTEALLGCTLKVDTIEGPRAVDLKKVEFHGYKHILEGKGV